jgi:hypothetical protein
MADEVRELLDAAEKQGWRVELTKKGHWRCYAPDGINIVIVSGTPSDRRSLRNAIAQMRRYGFQWKGH